MTGIKRWVVPMRGRTADEEHRASTPLELFFDLVIVVAIAVAAGSLHHGIAEDHDQISVQNGTFGYPDVTEDAHLLAMKMPDIVLFRFRLRSTGSCRQQAEAESKQREGEGSGRSVHDISLMVRVDEVERMSRSSVIPTETTMTAKPVPSRVHADT